MRIFRSGTPPARHRLKCSRHADGGRPYGGMALQYATTHTLYKLPLPALEQVAFGTFWKNWERKLFQEKRFPPASLSNAPLPSPSHPRLPPPARSVPLKAGPFGRARRSKALFPTPAKAQRRLFRTAYDQQYRFFGPCHFFRRAGLRNLPRMGPQPFRARLYGRFRLRAAASCGNGMPPERTGGRPLGRLPARIVGRQARRGYPAQPRPVQPDRRDGHDQRYGNRIQ